MRVSDIEALPEVEAAAKVLANLEDCGLVKPAIAAGWTRAKLTDSTTSDIDVAYVGPVDYEEAQHHLAEVITKLGYDAMPWDLGGIWNAQMAYGVEHTVDNFLLYYVSSIDTVYLASDGKLHDPTGFGFQDAESRLLRINDYDLRHGITPVPQEEVNICLEACRRIAQLGWRVTPESEERMIAGVPKWDMLTAEGIAYFVRKFSSKFKPTDRDDARLVYDRYGWGFLFDLMTD